MTVLSLRRAALWAVCASAALLAACGSSTTESALTPSRIISFGDAQNVATSGSSYTVNDGSINNWVQQFASSYGLSVAPSSAGGLNYAQGNARVLTKPDAAGSNSTLTIKEQIDAFLASKTLGENDVVLVNGGISDVVAQMAVYNASGQTEAQMQANLNQAALDLAAQIRRLVAAGGKHVVVANLYDLSISPWATATGRNPELQRATRTFNDRVKITIADLGATVLLVDAEYYYNLLSNTPTAYAFADNSTLHNGFTPLIACTSVDSGAGIGTGTGQVNSSLCTTSTIAAITPVGANVTYDQYVFADRLYFTPLANRLFGLYAYDRVHTRW